VNSRGDAALDDELGLVALEHDAGKYLQDRDADARSDAERNETVEPILDLGIDAHYYTPLARSELRKASHTIRTGCRTQ
jgi:hypothetical protein